jgi:hypothetical protein
MMISPICRASGTPIKVAPTLCGHSLAWLESVGLILSLNVVDTASRELQVYGYKAEVLYEVEPLLAVS